MLSHPCFEYCRFAMMCAVGVAYAQRNTVVWCDSLLLLKLIVKTLNERNERSVENTLVSTHTADKRGFVVVALNS